MPAPSAFIDGSISNTRCAIRLASTAVKRGGTNLVDRHTRRIKFTPRRVNPGNQQHRPPRDIRVLKNFRGLVIPEKPRPPTANECCMSRCDICVYDIYLNFLRAYRHDVQVARSVLVEWHVPQEEWPMEFRTETELDAWDREAGERNAIRAYEQRASHMGNASNTWTSDVWLEAMRLFVWVLRGCRG